MYIHIHTHLYVYIYIYLKMYVQIHDNIYTYIHIYTYIYIYKDIVCHCDVLMSSLLSSPLTGRMHISPDIGLTPETCAHSLATALQL